MKKKRFFFLLGCLLLLTGCWDQKELSEITVVTGMAVDKGRDGKYDLTVEGINSQELSWKTGKGNAPATVFTLSGNTISELSQKMNVGLSKYLIYSHMRTLVIDEKIAREGIIDFLDYLERNREIRDDFNILVARNVKASDVLKVTYTFQKASTLKLHTQLDSMVHNWGGDPNVRLNDVIKAWVSAGREPVMAAVAIKGNPKKGLSVDNMKKVSPDALVVLDSLGIFKDNKLKAFLPIEDTRNFLWTQNKITHTAVSVPCAKKKFFPLRVYRNTTSTKARMERGIPHITLNIYSEAYLDGMQCTDDLTDVKTYLKYEKLASKTIKQNIAGTIQKLQKKYHSDIFGFGDVLYRQDNHHFRQVEKKWDQLFSQAKVDIHVQVQIHRSGIRTKTLLRAKK